MPSRPACTRSPSGIPPRKGKPPVPEEGRPGGVPLRPVDGPAAQVIDHGPDRVPARPPVILAEETKLSRQQGLGPGRVQPGRLII